MEQPWSFDKVLPARVFIGRAAALELLLAHAAEARAGRGAMVLAHGEPGIGKTRLFKELERRVDGLGVFWGLCAAGDGEPAYGPWMQVLRQLLRRRADGAAPPAELLAAVAPLLAAGAAGRPPASAAIGTLTSDDPSRLALFDAVVQLLEHACAHAPLCLVLDDLHAADEATLRLASYVARRAHQLPLLVVGSYRDVEGRERATLVDLARVGEDLALTGLGDDEVQALLEAFGAQPSPELVARLRAATGGNPFFLGELAREGLRGREGGGEPAGLQVSERAGAVIRGRVARLGPDDREVLEVAAVAGQRFDPATVAAVLDRPPAAVLDCCAVLQREGLLEPPAGPGDAWQFRHDLVRQAVEGELSAERRARLHDALAGVIEARHAPDLDAVGSVLAWHAYAALPLGDAARAVRHCRSAGERALRRLAYEDAVAHFERALAVIGSGSEGDQGVRSDLLLGLGDAAFRSGDVERANGAYQQVIERARHGRDAVRMGRALLGTAGPVEAGAVDQRRVTLIEEALAWLPAEASALRARLLARLAWELSWVAEAVDRKRGLCADAIEMARTLGDPATLAYTLGVVRFAVWSHANETLRLGAASEIIQLAEQANDPVLAMEGHHWRVVDLLEQGEIAGVDREIDAHDRRASAFGIPHYLWWTALWRAMRAIVAGRFDDAETLIGAALERGNQVRPENAEAAMGGQMFTLLIEQGREEALASLVGVYDATEHWTTIRYEVAAGLAWVAAELGRLDEARSRLAPFRRDGIPVLMLAPAWSSSLAATAAAAATIGDAALCAQTYDMLLPSSGRVVVVGPAIAAFGPVDRFLGIVATALGRYDDAERHLLAALDLSRRLASPPFIARTQYDLGALYLRRGAAGDGERARAALAQALAEAERLGMLRVAARSRDLLAGNAGAAVPVAAPAGECIWQRDGEYWRLTYDGLTVHLRDSVGLRCLARLLAAPNVRQPALALMADAGGGAMLVAGDTGPRLDARARAEYGRRLAELRQAHEAATAANDLGRAAQAAAELAQIEAGLAAALGLDGRVRRDGAPAERARQSATKAIKKALARIRAVHPRLGEHLDRAVRTGTECVYLVEPRAGIRWSVAEAPRP